MKKELIEFLIANAGSLRIFLEGEDGKTEIALAHLNIEGILADNPESEIGALIESGRGVLNSGDGEYFYRFTKRKGKNGRL